LIPQFIAGGLEPIKNCCPDGVTLTAGGPETLKLAVAVGLHGLVATLPSASVADIVYW